MYSNKRLEEASNVTFGDPEHYTQIHLMYIEPKVRY